MSGSSWLDTGPAGLLQSPFEVGTETFNDVTRLLIWLGLVLSLLTRHSEPMTVAVGVILGMTIGIIYSGQSTKQNRSRMNKKSIYNDYNRLSSTSKSEETHKLSDELPPFQPRYYGHNPRFNNPMPFGDYYNAVTGSHLPYTDACKQSGPALAQGIRRLYTPPEVWEPEYNMYPLPDPTLMARQPTWPLSSESDNAVWDNPFVRYPH